MLNITKYIVLIGMLMFIFTACSPETETKQGYFQDKAFESAVLHELDSEEANVTDDDLASIESMEVPDAGITDLDGIESLITLNYLDVTGNEIDDLSPLLSLETLEPWREINGV